MAKKLKVYSINLDGRHEYIVATTSRAAAQVAFQTSKSHMREFGVITGNPAAIEAAMAMPGVVLKRKGQISNAPFEVDTVRLETQP